MMWILLYIIAGITTIVLAELYSYYFADEDVVWKLSEIPMFLFFVATWPVLAIFSVGYIIRQHITLKIDFSKEVVAIRHKK